MSHTKGGERRCRRLIDYGHLKDLMQEFHGLCDRLSIFCFIKNGADEAIEVKTQNRRLLTASLMHNILCKPAVSPGLSDPQWRALGSPRCCPCRLFGPEWLRLVRRKLSRCLCLLSLTFPWIEFHIRVRSKENTHWTFWTERKLANLRLHHALCWQLVCQSYHIYCQESSARRLRSRARQCFVATWLCFQSFSRLLCRTPTWFP